MFKSEFLLMIDAAIKYFDPNQSENDINRKILESANETKKIEIDRLQRAINESNTKIQKLHSENRILSGNLSFSVNEITGIQSENEDQKQKISEMNEIINERKKYLEEVYSELTSQKRLQSNAEIATRRNSSLKSKKNDDPQAKKIKINTEVSKEKLREEVNNTEEKLEQAICQIKKIQEDLRKKDELIHDLKFRLGIESKEQKRLNIQNVKLNKDLLNPTQHD